MTAKVFKIFVITALFLFGSIQFQAQTCAIPPIGLVSNYAAENNTLEARSRNNGTIQNGVAYTAGKVGQAFNLAG
ncbi:MAG TPA: hypothetical protein PKY59_24430, partial [Pyrinomonadaceae bacterium]|nr:hypothetical protein [Pyrinomonadaceae bacterium]